ncbi:MAG: NAD-dependent epimerase/dehydratase family protein, partial [Chitinophagaceae bacterium]
MKVIIFGINGQDGYYLDALLKRAQIDVIGVSRSTGKWLTGNITDRNFVETLTRQHQPDYIFNLAANSTVKHEALFENHET